MDGKREFDFVLWGATGFLGTLVAEYLVQTEESDEIDWAIAGRNEEKLRALRDDLNDIGSIESLGVLVGDASDRASLESIAERTAVVCTTVGPFAKYGSELVEACLAAETDYCDVAAEIHWIRDMIEAHHEEAQNKGVRIVHCCGLDSVPSDLGTLMVQDWAHQKYGAYCDTIKFGFAGAGGFSGGTLASLANMLEEASEDPELLELLFEPYALTPEGSGSDDPTQLDVRYSKELETWTALYPMALVNEKNVHRTNAILDHPYGRDFRYSEAIRCGPGSLGAIFANMLNIVFRSLYASLMNNAMRGLITSYLLPEPGEGPTREEVEDGYFDIELVGFGTTPSGEDFRVEGEMHADSDPGYGATAKIFGETALCLCRDSLEKGLPGGVLTPASAMGMRLVERLRKAGMRWEIGDEGRADV